MAISKIPGAGVSADTLEAGDIAANAIGSSEIADDAVGTDQLSNAVAISTTGAITTTGAFTSVGIDDNASGATAITIDATEKVGIGEASPDRLLHLKGAASGHTYLRMESPSGSNLNNYIEFKTQNDTKSWAIAARSDDDGNKLDIGSNTNSNVLVLNSNGTIGLHHSGGTGQQVFIENQDSANGRIGLKITSPSSSANNSAMEMQVTRSNSSAYRFLKCLSNSGNDEEFLVRGDGYVQADGSISGGHGDYAEYFESKTGEAIPVGTTVKLDGDKVVACSESDTPMGVIRPNGSAHIVANDAWNKWYNKYLCTDFGAYIFEEYTATEWTVDEEKHSYPTDSIPADLTVPADAVVTSEDEDGNKLMRRKLNPDYDESQTYIPRENRDEWVIVGLLGQIPITKGQPVADSWIKMKDVSETVEMWFVK